MSPPAWDGTGEGIATGADVELGGDLAARLCGGPMIVTEHPPEAFPTDCVYFHDDQGRLRALSASWTNLAADDPFVAVSAGRSAFRVVDLLELTVLIMQLREIRDA